ncbi:hypothetical protein NMY22_g26 [Coprinellus aureogranulatus]|nr:hypothetical protein NMY22_g26 [Coprinellus aureogranulatus]
MRRKRARDIQLDTTPDIQVYCISACFLLCLGLRGNYIPRNGDLECYSRALANLAETTSLNGDEPRWCYDTNLPRPVVSTMKPRLPPLHLAAACDIPLPSGSGKPYLFS